ncbi:MAG TPA: QueT transporter family protein [Patescibacteria group bacterium]|jgi:uncharacterized membrane protein|nr:QueT transporter family protein [Patescibacteria group bacterium]
MKNVRFMVQAAVIAAVYVVVTLSFAPLSSGLFQLRFSEALTVLPALTSAAIPGLFIGCLLGNLLVGASLVDIIFGSLTTLAAAYLSYRLRNKKWLVPLPPVLLNAVVVGIMLVYVYGVPVTLFAAMAWVAAGQFVACYIIGYPLLTILGRYKDKIFNM